MVFGVGAKADGMTEVAICKGSACERDEREDMSTRKARIDLGMNIMTAN